MSDFVLPPGAYRRLGREFSIKEPTKKQIKALSYLIPKNESVIDIGCHKGVYVQALKEQGYEAFGIDGICDIENKTNGLVKWCDLTADCSEFFQSADWGLFLEVGEHVPKEFECSLFDNVSAIPRKRLVVSWAHINVGIGKHKHINCRTQVYVASEFSRRGWFVDDEATIELRYNVYSRTELKQRIMVLKKDCFP